MTTTDLTAEAALVEDAPQLDSALSTPAQFLAAAGSWAIALKPTADLVMFANAYPTLHDTWRACSVASWMLGMLEWTINWGLRPSVGLEQLRLFACWSARRCVKHWKYERYSRANIYVEPAASRKRPMLRAIRAIERFYLGEMSNQAMLAHLEAVFPRPPEGWHLTYEHLFGTMRGTILSLPDAESFEAATRTQMAALRMAAAIGSMKRVRGVAPVEFSDKRERRHFYAAKHENMVHVRRLRALFGNPFEEVNSAETIKVARALGIRPWECSACGTRISEVVRRPDGVFRRCRACKRLYERLDGTQEDTETFEGAIDSVVARFECGPIQETGRGL